MLMGAGAGVKIVVGVVLDRSVAHKWPFQHVDALVAITSNPGGLGQLEKGEYCIENLIRKVATVDLLLVQRQLDHAIGGHFGICGLE